MLNKIGAIAITGLLLVFAAQAITVSGDVSNASTQAMIPNAVVSFQTFGGGGANTYRDTTTTAGLYSLTLTGTPTGGILTVTATGYNQSTQFIQGLTTRDTTINISLTPTGTNVNSGIIHGAATDADGNAVQGVRIILLRRQGGGAGTPVDTMLSLANGSYSFDSLPASRYDLVPSKTGYAVANPTAIVGIMLAAGQNLTVDIDLQAASVRAGSVVGKITSAANQTGIGSAQVVLNQTVGGVLTPIDTATTIAAGATTGDYSFAVVPAGRNYTVTASATGFVTRTSAVFVVDSARVDTVNLALQVRVAAAGIIKGTVVDSATRAGLQDARVVLRIAAGGGAAQPIDTVATLANGTYEFAGLGIGTYSLLVTKTDYRTYTTPFNRSIQLTTNPDTAVVDTIRLAPLAKGNLSIYTANNAGALSGVSIVAVEQVGMGQTGQTYSGVTAAGGWLTFSNVPAATYSVTASLTGYNTQVRSTTVAGSANDTLRMTLTAATGSSKVVKGTVKTASGANINQAVVLLRTTRAGTTITLVDTTDANGAYSIAGIPVANMTVSLEVSKTGYATRDTLNIPILNDTTTVNIVLVSGTGVIRHASADVKDGFAVVSTANGVVLQMTGYANGARVTVFSSNGEIVMNRAVSGRSSIELPRSLSHQMAIIQVQQGSMIQRQTIMLP